MLGLTPRQLRLVLRHPRARPAAFWGLCVLGLLTALLETFSVLAVLPLAAALTEDSREALLRWGPVFAALVLLRSAALLAHARLSAAEGAKATHGIRVAGLDAYAAAPETELLELRAGRATNAMLRGAGATGTIVMRLPQLAAEAARALGLAALLLWLDVRLAFVTLAAGAALWAALGRLLGGLAGGHARGRAQADARQSVVLQEFLQGARVIRLAGAVTSWRERFAQASGEAARHHAAAQTLQALPKAWFDAGAALLVLGWMLLAGRGHSGLRADLPVLAALLVGASKLMPCLAAVGRHRLDLIEALPYAETLEDLLERAPAGPPRAGRAAPASAAGLRLDGVRFSYPGRPELLKGVDLELEAGRRLAIAGPFGSGKTTLLGLILGVHAPSAGSILVGGRPLAELDPASWRGGIGVVPQEQFLFHGSVADNILLGRAGFGLDDAKEAAALAGADGFISSLPEGYATVVGERGLRLSGGQRQLLVLARALLGRPSLLVLDEPAQSLDPRAQEELGRALSRAARGRTVVAAMHRPDWADWADEVVHLREGRLTPS